jgi:hypothetical protein
MKLFQSIFGGGESRGRYPETLIEAGIERAVDGTDPRLRLLPGYRNRLREPVLKTFDHVVELVDGLPAPLGARREDYGREPTLAAFFASPDEMLQTFGKADELTDYLSGPEGAGAQSISTLLFAERIERGILGMDLVDDQVLRDVPQVTVSFSGHRLLDPRDSEEQMRRQLKRRAFDHLLSLALTRISEVSAERADLTRQRDLLKRKLAALKRGGWSFEETDGPAPDPAALVADLDAITAELEALGMDRDVLDAHLAIVTELLAEPESQLWSQGVTLYLDAMNIERGPDYPSVRRIDLQELHNARGRRLAMLPLALAPAELPPREDLVTAAQRYLY